MVGNESRALQGRDSPGKPLKMLPCGFLYTAASQTDIAFSGR